MQSKLATETCQSAESIGDSPIIPMKNNDVPLPSYIRGRYGAILVA